MLNIEYPRYSLLEHAIEVLLRTVTQEPLVGMNMPNHVFSVYCPICMVTVYHTVYLHMTVVRRTISMYCVHSTYRGSHCHVDQWQRSSSIGTLG